MTVRVQAPTREEFSERLLKGSVKRVLRAGRRHRLGRAARPGQVLPAAEGRVALRHPDVGRDDARAADRAVPPGVRQHAVGGHLVREHPEPGAAAPPSCTRIRQRDATHYALTELGDETRHMVMFGKAIERVGAKPVQPRRYQRRAINALPLAFKGSFLWVAALIGEEIFDSLQRQMMDDPELQPMVQRLMRIHVTEEVSPHPVRARRGAQARRRHAAGQPVVGGQHQRPRRRLLPAPVHQPRAVPPRRPGRARSAPRRTDQPDYHEVQRWGSRRWPRSCTRSG